MKKIIIFIGSVSVIGIIIFWSGNKNVKQNQNQSSRYSQVKNSMLTIKNKSMKIVSPNFSEGEIIPSKFTCDGESINPELKFSEIPPEAKSLALLADDPDAPGGTFNHWVMWNIDPTVKEIKENSQPAGAISGINSGGTNGYIGPCPPSGTHRYYFKLYALDAKLNLNSASQKKDLEKAMRDHIISEAEWMGKYNKK